MPTPADEALAKITLNIYAKDLEKLKRRFSSGYTEAVRRIVRKWIRDTERYEEDEPDWRC